MVEPVLRAPDLRGPLALVGLRGCGKSTVGRLLARRLARRFIDLDDATLEQARFAGHAGPMASVGELLERLGELEFRRCEAQALRVLCEGGCRVVLATGGGAVERADNRAWLRRAATTVWLRAPVAELARRLSEDPTPRPPLLGADPVAEVAELARRREGFYREVAQHVVECGDVGPETVVQRVLDVLGATASVAPTIDSVGDSFGDSVGDAATD